MMREPWFWRQKTPLARAAAAALWPTSAVYDAAQRVRLNIAKPGAPAAPVICIGNATLGGVGKTPCAILVNELLTQAGVIAHFQTRGYGGALAGPLRVKPSAHNFKEVGDEALLLAKHGAVWVAKTRAAGVRAAIIAGARAVIMDDGYQNPTVAKSLSILLIDHSDPAGNGKIFPAGPLREPLGRAMERAGIILLCDEKDAYPSPPALPLPTGKPVFHAWLESVETPPRQRVIAFCGIGRPAKFFTLLKTLGFDVAREISFPDHHIFTDRELRHLKALGENHQAVLITTEKDYIRLPAPAPPECLTLPVRMRVDDMKGLYAQLREAIDAGPHAG